MDNTGNTGNAEAPAGRRRRQKWRDRLPPWLRRHPAALARRVLAAVFFLTATVLAALPAVGSQPGEPLVVAARDLPLGTTVGSGDVRVVRVPASLRPDGSLSEAAQAEGRRLVGSVRAGEPLTDARFADTAPNPPGTVTVPVRLADGGVTELLLPGTRVDVVTVASDEQGANVLARMVTVLRVVAPTESGGPGSTSARTGPLVLLSAPPDVASRLATASLSHPLTITLR